VYEPPRSVSRAARRRGVGGGCARIAFRCDGDERSGAGHIARCLPLAAALEELGWHASFLGRYSGLAGWLLSRAKARVEDAEEAAPCGIPAGRYRAAVVDSYRLAPSDICALCEMLPVLTVGEGNRCRQRGILLDYHLDCRERSSAHLLCGPAFAPLDRALAGAGRPGADVRRVLVSAGGSTSGRALLAEMIRVAAGTFPRARIVVAAGPGGETSSLRAELETNFAHDAERVQLPAPAPLVELLREVDLAVSTAGFTAYELACAGVPQAAVAIAANQLRVLRGLSEREIAACVDLVGASSPSQELARTVARLRDPALRRRSRERGMAAFDGHGARRAAAALTELFD
jgi:spore coat polysaccharide biosynthesis predicted glycosyltransferase SpsG